MAEEVLLLTELLRAARLLDDDALASLASRGLVRRAQKDLEAQAPALRSAEGGAAVFEIDGQTVTLRLPPGASRCTCAAGGVCRHVLACWIFLSKTADASGGAEAAGAAGVEILALDERELRSWAGAALLRRALKALADGLAMAFDEGPPWTARIAEWSRECRWLPGGGLAGMLCSCRAERACVHRVAAVLEWRRRGGARIPETPAAPPEAREAPRRRDEVAASVEAALEEALAAGLASLSPAAIERFESLAAAAHGVELPRLERSLRGLAGAADLWLRRDARGDSSEVFARAARVAALAAALGRGRWDLAGAHRAGYEDVGELELEGAGARVWLTPGGHHGLTVYFRDLKGGAWCSWTDARPAAQGGFHPRARFQALGPWSGCPSPEAACHSRFRLRRARRAREGRLSGREGAQYLRLGEARPLESVDAIERWSALEPLARRAFAFGLADRDARDAWVVLRPARWGEAAFDAPSQELILPIADRDGRPLPLVLAYDELRRPAIEALEAAAATDAARWPAVFGILRLHRRALALEPVSLLGERAILNLDFAAGGVRPPAAGAAPGADAEAAARVEREALDDGGRDGDDEGDHDEDGAHPVPESGPVGDLLRRTADRLLGFAARGAAAAPDRGQVEALAREAADAGLATLAEACGRLLGDGAAPALSMSPRQRARALLRAHYALLLAMEACAVEEAVGG